MNRRDPIRNVFRDPDIGDAIKVYGDTYEVIAIDHHPGKTVVQVRIDGQANRLRNISLESWRAYSDDAEVLTNRSKTDAFDAIE